jgi:hypothetical protein
MSRPMEPELPAGQDGIPAADPGRGAPPPAEGYGVSGEARDRDDGEIDPVDVTVPVDTPFRTPDPADIGPEQGSVEGSQ